MSWSRVRDDDGLFEFEREDGYATIRVRRRPDGTWAVRLDRLTQAPEGSTYRQERRDSHEAATTLAEEWCRRYDVDEE